MSENASVPTLEVEIKARLNSRPVCSGCGCKRPGYDRLSERRFQFIPMWGNQVFLVEEFQLFWQYISPCWAGEFLDKWCTKTMRSKIEPMKRVARMLRRHRPLLLNWF